MIITNPTGCIRSFAAVCGVLILSGCASASDPKPAICDGKHRRPANPYGSVLPTTPAPDSAKPASLSAPRTPGAPAAAPASPPGPRASLDPRSFEPCGARA